MIKPTHCSLHFAQPAPRLPWALARVGLITALLTLMAFGIAIAQTQNGEIVKDFQNRIDKYVELQKQQHVANQPSESAAKVAEDKHEATRKILRTRSTAKQGEVFTPQIGSYFKRQLALTLNGAEGAKIRASLRHAEPLPNVHLEVNEKYPPNLPLQSTPPTLLANLPRLPGQLQYRIVGQTLVLYDAASGLIVDFLPDAIPERPVN